MLTLKIRVDAYINEKGDRYYPGGEGFDDSYYFTLEIPDNANEYDFVADWTFDHKGTWYYCNRLEVYNDDTEELMYECEIDLDEDD